MIVWLTAAALANPHADAVETLRTRTARALAVDQIQGIAHPPGLDALQWPSITHPWLVARAPEARHGGTCRDLTVTLRPELGVAEGDWAPWGREGDAEPGWVGIRPYVDAGVQLGPLFAQLAGSPALNLGPTTFDAERLSYGFGVQTPGFHAGLWQRPRWFGPARIGALILTDNARSNPAGEIGGTWRFPGKADVIGRFSTELVVGVVPGKRRDVTAPGFLVLDLRWQPVPWIEVGATRGSMFGGFTDGSLRPIDVGQLVLPTRPHVEDDPNRLLPDTDERVAIDARVSIPLGLWLDGPVDYVELYIQHGGEDVIGRRLGPIPVPSLAGTANVYGGEISFGPGYLGAEVAIVEDDVFRWYVGHRVYHDGWTRRGRPMGHPQGGDSRSVAFRGGAQSGDWSVEATFLRLGRVQVADRVGDTVFVFPAAERTTGGEVRVTRALRDSGLVSVEFGAFYVENRDFVPGADRLEHRVQVRWRPRVWTAQRNGS